MPLRDRKRSMSYFHCRTAYCPQDGPPLMTSTLATLILAAASTGQHPTAASNASPAMSAEEVVRLESRHLTNIRQVTSGLSRAGEGYFGPDGRVDHFPGGAISGSVDFSPPQAR